MERKEDTAVAASFENMTDQGATSSMTLASDVEKCSSSTAKDDTVSTDEVHPMETESEIEETKNIEIRSEEVESNDSVRTTSYFRIEDGYSHDVYYCFQKVHPAILRNEKRLYYEYPKYSTYCWAKFSMKVVLLKNPLDGFKYFQYFFTVSRPIRKHIHGDFVMEVYNAEGLYLRSCKSSGVFTNVNTTHEFFRIRLSELGESKDKYLKFKLFGGLKGCCKKNLPKIEQI